MLKINLKKKDYHRVKTIILCGKSGSGKTTALADLAESPKFRRIVTDTTRPMREGEVDGVSYHFDTPEEFERISADGGFAETAEYDASFGHCAYGSRISEYRSNDSRIAVVVLNPFGVKAVTQKLNPDEVAVIYIDAPDFVLKERLMRRGDKDEEIRHRLKSDDRDFAGIENYADITLIANSDTKPDEVSRTIDKLFWKGASA